MFGARGRIQYDFIHRTYRREVLRLRVRLPETLTFSFSANDQQLTINALRQIEMTPLFKKRDIRSGSLVICRDPVFLSPLLFPVLLFQSRAHKTAPEGGARASSRCAGDWKKSSLLICSGLPVFSPGRTGRFPWSPQIFFVFPPFRTTGRETCAGVPRRWFLSFFPPRICGPDRECRLPAAPVPPGRRGCRISLKILSRKGSS